MPDPLVQELADQVAIRTLSVRYNHLSDAGDGAAYAQLYTPDGLWELDDGLERYVGNEQLAELCVTHGPGSLHVTTDPLIEISGDTASQISRLLIFTVDDRRRSNDFVATGQYADELVRTEDGWRFKSRRIRMNRDFTATPDA
jgi:hypothetical protein